MEGVVRKGRKRERSLEIGEQRGKERTDEREMSQRHDVR